MMAAFTTWDYILFGLLLLVSSGIGVYFGFSGGQQKTTEDYLLAGKDMSILPVAFSLMASFHSAITLMGIPAEIYIFGFNLAYLCVGHIIGMILCAYFIHPVFFDLQISTVYEYIEKRFGKTSRLLTSTSFVIQMILFISTILYAPALALSAIAKVPISISVILIGCICTFYSTIGGMKAVLWNDVLQAILMCLSVFTVLAKGFIDFGFTQVFTTSYEGGRLSFPGYGLDFTTRYTVWNILLQGIVLSMSTLGANQVQVQRLLTVKNVSRARKSLFVSNVMGSSFYILNCFVGLVIFVAYQACDPLTSSEKLVTSPDQLLPFYIITTLNKYPGLPGLCICGIFSATLSTVSSAINSLTAVTMQDLVRPFIIADDRKWTCIAKVITLLYGSICIALTFVVAAFGNLMQASLTVFGMLGSPVLGVILLGMLTTRANEYGVVCGLVSSVALYAWISFGASAYAPLPPTLPLSTEGCISNSSSHTLPTASAEEYYVFPLYTISYMWFAPIGLIFSIVIGYISSILIDKFYVKNKDVSNDLLSPLVKYFMRRIEKPARKISNAVELQNFNSSRK